MAEQRPGQAAAYHHGDLRNALIQAGLAILAEEGAHALSLRAAARRSGVSHAAPYRHFPDKEALLAAIAEQGFNTLAATVRAATARFPDNPAAQLEEAGWAYVQFALQHPAHLRVMFGGMIGTPAAHSAMRVAGATAFTLLVEIMRTGQRAGVIVDGSPEQLALTSWSLVHGLAMLLIEQQLPAGLESAEAHERLTRQCGDLLYQGLRKREPPV
jgi:AcrR family transcriptional regulator